MGWQRLGNDVALRLVQLPQQHHLPIKLVIIHDLLKAIVIGQ